MKLTIETNIEVRVEAIARLKGEKICLYSTMKPEMLSLGQIDAEFANAYSTIAKQLEDESLPEVAKETSHGHKA